MKTDSPTLTLRSSPGQGMHVHIARAKKDAGKIKNEPGFVPISQTGNTRTYFYQEWSKLGNHIVELASAVWAAERAAFELLRQDVSHACIFTHSHRVSTDSG